MWSSAAARNWLPLLAPIRSISILGNTKGTAGREGNVGYEEDLDRLTMLCNMQVVFP